MQKPCKSCEGTGLGYYPNQCYSCNGTGVEDITTPSIVAQWIDQMHTEFSDRITILETTASELRLENEKLLIDNEFYRQIFVKMYLSSLSQEERKRIGRIIGTHGDPQISTTEFGITLKWNGLSADEIEVKDVIL